MKQSSFLDENIEKSCDQGGANINVTQFFFCFVYWYCNDWSLRPDKQFKSKILANQHILG